jgi:3-oxosteroid 1-dehydrogenase
MTIDHCDVLVIGSGSAALSAALRAAKGGFSVLITEKSDQLGGTSAMSGAGIWIPANHIARKAGIVDSEDDALPYLRSASPPGWQEKEDALWQAFVRNAPRMLEFICDAMPLTFELVDQPDPFAEMPGGKACGRMVSPLALSRNLLGAYASALRRSYLPHVLTYREIYDNDIQHHPARTIF